jgi:hypothetical protein
LIKALVESSFSTHTALVLRTLLTRSSLFPFPR